MPRITKQHIIAGMRRAGCEFQPGLTATEVVAIEKRYDFQFPPDLRLFLQTALPTGDRFPNWRDGNEQALREWLDQPRQGILFDIEHSGFWRAGWGPQPTSLARAKSIASKHIAAAPVLIPIYAHRFIPVEPHLPCNPVLSVHHTDIILYGATLHDYLVHEFVQPEKWQMPAEIRQIVFWSDLVS